MGKRPHSLSQLSNPCWKGRDLDLLDSGEADWGAVLSHPLGSLGKPTAWGVCAEPTTHCPDSHLGCLGASWRSCPAKLAGSTPVRMVHWEATLWYPERSCPQGGSLCCWPMCVAVTTRWLATTCCWYRLWELARRSAWEPGGGKLFPPSVPLAPSTDKA